MSDWEMLTEWVEALPFGATIRVSKTGGGLFLNAHEHGLFQLRPVPEATWETIRQAQHVLQPLGPPVDDNGKVIELPPEESRNVCTCPGLMVHTDDCAKVVAERARNARQVTMSCTHEEPGPCPDCLYGTQAQDDKDPTK